MKNKSIQKIFPEERRRQIRTLVSENGRVSVDELALQFAVSPVTIRTDLDRLEQEGIVQRTHGGAIALATDVSRADFSFSERQSVLEDEKQRIGASAASLVQNGSTILLDASTTTLQMAKHLGDRRGLTVLTNCLPIAMEFEESPNTTVVILGGIVRPSSWVVVGAWINQILNDVNIDQAFLGCKGISPQAGATDVNAWVIEAKRLMVAAAGESIVLADHEKWGRVAFASFAGLSEISTVISGSEAPTAMVQSVKNQDVNVITV